MSVQENCGKLEERVEAVEMYSTRETNIINREVNVIEIIISGSHLF